ncbi:PTS transporter subunit IIC [Aneurinibacillus thermoaerophilus]|uniref:PTS transporter subunit IIC n=1 Tax=Aneurinibacillus thermoaerophilus TaxID=143495 RepID=UPI002675655E|nr:PTS transporter subunit IIC [Aneurinibacillus thermoaerophilus]
MPGTLVLAVFLPGNKVLPFVDLASLIFLVPMAVPYLKKKLIRLFLSGIVIILYAGSSIAPFYTKTAEMVNVTLPENLQSATDTDHIPFLKMMDNYYISPDLIL